MIIVCNNCNRKIDLNSRNLILYYLEGGVICCPDCKNDIFLEKGNETNEY